MRLRSENIASYRAIQPHKNSPITIVVFGYLQKYKIQEWKLAEKCGISRMALNKIKNGKSLPDSGTFCRLIEEMKLGERQKLNLIAEQAHYQRLGGRAR